MSLPGQITFADIENHGLKINPKPKWLIVPKGKLWCPYCNWAKKFNKDKRLGVRRCEGCGVSTNDYNVKKHNKLEIFNTRHRKKNRKRN